MTVTASTIFLLLQFLKSAVTELTPSSLNFHLHQTQASYFAANHPIKIKPTLPNPSLTRIIH